ncbi:Bdr family repetitive protein (plasmid) [Borrelia sp. CA_690]|uniref:DUF1640 domain-containing protein n=1 Tax=Borrelia maritima TaxID=2761123 RepID=A0A5J6WE24_9SPIR|nr:Bdr family repetitive protein [Borrelia maritima]QFI15095.1 hypothetical protein DB723_05340 [Borrelia maritima]
MSNLAYRTYNIESIKNEFLNIGFSEDTIDFVLLHNNNYNFEFLEEKMIYVEKNLNARIDNVEKSLNEKLSMGNSLIYFMILTTAMLGPILNTLFMKYLQGGKYFITYNVLF